MITKKFRIESDSMGQVEVPTAALYGAQTQRALNNFRIGRQTLPWDFIRAIILVKKSAAATNLELALITEERAAAIIAAADKLLLDKPSQHFPISVFQTGSGTSTNMNVNEVITGMAQHKGVIVSANDHVNLGQSSNDVIPSAIHIAAVCALHDLLLPAFTRLSTTIRSLAGRCEHILTTGRTHLMDALPILISEEFLAWAEQIDENRERIQSVLPRLQLLALGGTAVGSGVNCHKDFPEKTLARISQHTGHVFRSARSLYKALSSMDTVVECSGHLKTAAVSLLKIANDLRWMNSGPLSGLGEIQLPALQPGSSIMPAKVNPVIPEAVCMACTQVIGLDTAITLAGQAGNFQLNTMLPLIAANILESIYLISESAQSLAGLALEGLKVNEDRCRQRLDKNPILATALNREIGYLAAASIAKEAAANNETVIEVAKRRTDIPEEKLSTLLDPENMAKGPYH